LTLVFLAIAIGTIILARSLRSERLSRMIARWMSDSSILPVRISILILLGLVSLANELGMELVLGAYTAGMVIAMLTEVKILQYCLTSLGSGFFIPLFFKTSGEFDLRALLTSPESISAVPMFQSVRQRPIIAFISKDIAKFMCKDVRRRLPQASLILG
jgi:Kef-type K+ transport system membrane component KefB